MRSLLVVSVLVAMACPAAAGADGLPVLGIDVGGTGVAAGERERYVTFTLPRSTVLARVAQDGGQVAEWVQLDGQLTIPAVAYDGSAAGLAWDRETLVLVRPRRAFPQRSTRFAVVHAPTLRVREVLDLRGDFSFDALSPDGRLLYLVQYLAPDDPTRYLVRLYDLERRELQPEPIIDPREVGDVMRGEPVTRAASLDGRWAYTLYDAPGHPFVHALDTVGRTARCIDLHGLRPRRGQLAGLVLSVEDEVLAVREATGEALARIDTTTFEVFPSPEEDEAAGAAEPAATAPARDGERLALLALSLPGAALLGTFVLLARARGRSSRR